MSLERQSVAATALVPGNSIPKANLILGLLGLTSTASLTARLWRARSRQRLSHRWPFLLPLIVALYGLQTVLAFTATSSQQAQRAGATLVMIFFAVGIARSWELLGVRGGGLLDLLVARADRPDHADSAGNAEVGLPIMPTRRAPPGSAGVGRTDQADPPGTPEATSTGAERGEHEPGH